MSVVLGLLCTGKLKNLAALCRNLMGLALPGALPEVGEPNSGLTSLLTGFFGLLLRASGRSLQIESNTTVKQVACPQPSGSTTTMAPSDDATPAILPGDLVPRGFPPRSDGECAFGPASPPMLEAILKAPRPLCGLDETLGVAAQWCLFEIRGPLRGAFESRTPSQNASSGLRPPP